MLTLLTNPVSVAWNEDDLVLKARLTLKEDGTLLTWNGWVVPWFDRTEINRYIAWERAHAAEFPDQFDRAEWASNGSTLYVHTAGDPDGKLEYLSPIFDDEGVERWSLGACAWTWYEVDSRHPRYIPQPEEIVHPLDHVIQSEVHGPFRVIHPPCNEVLFSGNQPWAACTQPSGVEHSHSDHSAVEAIAAGLARPITDTDILRVAEPTLPKPSYFLGKAPDLTECACRGSYTDPRYTHTRYLCEMLQPDLTLSNPPRILVATIILPPDTPNPPQQDLGSLAIAMEGELLDGWFNTGTHVNITEVRILRCPTRHS